MQNADVERLKAWAADGVALFGPYWKNTFARVMGIDYATVKRWSRGAVRVPEHAVRFMGLLRATPRSRWPVECRLGTLPSWAQVEPPPHPNIGQIILHSMKARKARKEARRAASKAARKSKRAGASTG